MEMVFNGDCSCHISCNLENNNTYDCWSDLSEKCCWIFHFNNIVVFAE